MKWIPVLLSAMPLMATSHVNFINIEVEREAAALVITTVPEPLLNYDILKNEAYSVDKNTYDHMLDAPFRQTAFLMRTLERNRGAIYKNPSSPLPIISYQFELGLHDIKGTPIQKDEYKVVIGLDTEPGKGLITCEQSGLRFQFDIDLLTNDEEYGSFVNHAIFPFERKKMTLPIQDEFIIDLYFRWPKVEVNKSNFSVFDLFPSAILWDQGPIRKLKIHLGTTYCFKREGEWLQVRSEHPRAFSNMLKAYGSVLEAEQNGNPEEVIPLLEEYIERAPADKKALKKLMDYYVAEEMDAEAYDLISRFQPFFATIRGGLPNQRALAQKAERRRNYLLGLRGTFQKDASVLLAITSPEDNDLVTGTTDLRFALSANESPILQIECFFDEQRIADLVEPPFKTSFTADGAMGDARLRVVAYFENETYQETEIKIRTLAVDQEERVNLVPLRASVFQVRSGLDRELTKDDFEIKENKEVRPIENFHQSSAPLRIAILLDTSISMFGDKLRETQYAVKTFLLKLEPEDRASIYTFDDKVMKLSGFTNDYNGVYPRLMTLSPQGGTALFDAMLVSHDALLGQNGTKVMIVISDGDDNTSATTDLHVARLLKNSPVMVYSVILPGGFLANSQKGSHFLSEMARLSGSISTRLRSVDNLDQIFERIYQDLKSFYYMDYYSDYHNPNARKLRVRLKRSGAVIRTRALN